MSTVISWFLILFAAFLSPAMAGTYSQTPRTANPRISVKRVYVGTLGDNKTAAVLRDELIRFLHRTRGLEVVTSPDAADAIITGTSRIWVKEYIRTNPKPSSLNREPVYDGYLFVQLKGKNNQELWSCRVIPGKFSWDDITVELAKRGAKQFHAGLKEIQQKTDAPLSP